MSQVLAEPIWDLDELVENLVTEDDEPVDDIFSAKQQRLLTVTLYSSWKPSAVEENSTEPRPFFADSNIGVFFSPHEPPLVPDVFIALDVPPPQDMSLKRNRSYFVWEKGKVPDVVVEIVSNKKGDELTRKLRDYARIGVRYYVVLDPLGMLSDDVLRVYEPGIVGRFYLRNDYNLPNVELSLKIVRGEFEGMEDDWLRWCDKNGELLPTPDEKTAEANRQTAEAVRQTVEAQELAAQEKERAERLAAKLRELGFDPDAL